MAEEKDEEVIDSQDDTQDPAETTQTKLTVDDYNKLMKEKEELEEKNKKLYARLNKKPSETAKPLVETPNAEISKEINELRLKVDYGISDPEAIAFITKNGGIKAMENPFVKQTVDNMLSQKKSESAAVAEDNGKSEIEKKYTIDQLRSMPLEELEKILPHA